MKIKINCLLYIFLISFLSSCSGLYEGKKQNKSDEFLVEKKSSLVIPPNYEELPIPEDLTEKNDKEKNILKQLLLNSDEELNNTENTKDKNFENFLIEKIKKN